MAAPTDDAPSVGAHVHDPNYPDVDPRTGDESETQRNTPWTQRCRNASPEVMQAIAEQAWITAPNPGSDAAFDAGCECDRERNRDGEGASFMSLLAGVPIFDIDPCCPLHGKEAGG